MTAGDSDMTQSIQGRDPPEGVLRGDVTSKGEKGNERVFGGKPARSDALGKPCPIWRRLIQRVFRPRAGRRG